MLLEQRKDKLVLLYNGDIVFRPLTEFNYLKHVKYNGERIILEGLHKDIDLVETFNEGIFNVRYKKFRTQLREPEKIAHCLNLYWTNKQLVPLVDLICGNYIDTIKISTIKKFLSGFKEDLKFDSDRVYIKNRFAVDKNGQAHIKYKEVDKHLCVVVSGNLQNFIINSDIGKVELDYKTLEVITKTLFLLMPNLDDQVFVNQLPEELIKELKAEL